jgi:protein involved in polysaccharide export with SLBB domain
MLLAGCATPLCGVGDGAGNAQLFVSDVPRELNKVSHPTYRVEPPDILLIDAISLVRLPDTPLRPGDQLTIRLQNGLPIDVETDAMADPLEHQIELEAELAFKVVNGPYLIGPDGMVDLGPAYGKVFVVGLTVDGAQTALERHLTEVVGLVDPRLSVTVTDIAGKQAIAGEHLVRPDGTISLGIYGDVYVAGMSLVDVKCAIEAHLMAHLRDPEVRVDVLAYNSKHYYVIFDGAGFGETVTSLPCTGGETVLDAIANVQGLTSVSSKKIWIARPGPAGCNTSQVLDVNWRAIAAEGITNTNYQILPGDRIYVQADKLISLDNMIGKVIAPVERIFGFSLLGLSTVQEWENRDQGGIP